MGRGTRFSGGKRERARSPKSAGRQAIESRQNGRVSAEAAEQLHEALAIIIEGAPSGIMDATARMLTVWAGRYGAKD
jgi:hypothetical protein